MRLITAVAVLLVVALPLGPEARADSQEPQVRHELIALSELLDTVAKRSGKEFLIDRRVPPQVVTGTLNLRDIDYGILLSVLRNNSLAAIPSDGFTKVVPVSLVRQGALPVIRESDPSMPKDAWVTRLITLKNINAAALVPILRPMVQKEGHLAAVAGSNLLMIVAPYGVTEGLVDIAREADESFPGDQPEP